MSLNIRKGKKSRLWEETAAENLLFSLPERDQKTGIRKDFIDGKPIEYTKKGLLDVRRKVGIVFQNPDEQLFLQVFMRKSLSGY